MILENQSLTNGKFNYGEALQKSFLFYGAQRSGELPSNNRIDWRNDSALGDTQAIYDANNNGTLDPGETISRDLSGGYYDAGDYMKYAFPMAASMTMLSWGVVEYRDAYENSGQLDEVLDTIKWGIDWILKAHETTTDNLGNLQTTKLWGQVGYTDTDHSIWVDDQDIATPRPAYFIDQEKPGSDLAAEASAALASASIIFRDTDSVYADELLDNAKALFEFAYKYQGKYSDSITDASSTYGSNNYNDELAWGAAWLHKAIEANNGNVNDTFDWANNQTYLDIAKTKNTWVGGWTQSWSDKQYGTAILIAQEDPNYDKTNLENWLNNWTGDGTNNITYSNGGLAFLSEWGSLRYSANTAFLAGIYSDTVQDYNNRYSDFAKEQIDYILGDNPRESSYMVGFGDSYSQNPHHNSSHLNGSELYNGQNGWDLYNQALNNENILYGALVGGPSSSDDFNYVDTVKDYQANEVALDYNAGLTGALARLYSNYGGDPLTASELNDLPGITISGEDDQDKIVGGYIASWKINANSSLNEVPIDKLTHLFYAFADVTSDGTVRLNQDSGLDGDIGFLQSLKAQNPNLEILVSIGGANEEDFSSAGSTVESRENFVQSASQFMKNHGFDGIDIDWEFPKADEDENYIQLLAQLREELDIQSQNDNKQYLLTTAFSGSPYILSASDYADDPYDFSPQDLKATSDYVDFINVMTYDYHGFGETTTNHQAALYPSTNDTTYNASKLNADWAIQHYQMAGVPSQKIVLGTPLYGRTWTEVNQEDGLFQIGTPGAVFSYEDLHNQLETNGYQSYWDDSAKVPYIYSPEKQVFSTHENIKSVGNKVDYINQQELGGIFFWEISDDLPVNDSDSLINFAANKFLNTTQGDFTEMLDALGAFESGRPSEDPAQYVAINQLHFIGKYQFGEALLKDLGYYNGDTTPYPGSPKNDWIEETWTGKDGVTQLGLDLSTDQGSYPYYPTQNFSNSDFLGNQTAQENAIRQAFGKNITNISSQLQAKGRSIDEFLGETRTYTDKNSQTQTLTISMSGILAGAHLRGTTNVVDYLVDGTVTEDENGTPITQYINEYGGYDTPFGTNNSDALLGTSYNDVLIGFGGNDNLTGSTGADAFRFNSPNEGIDTITDFNPTQGDKIELQYQELEFDVEWWVGESREFYPAHQFYLGSGANNEFTRIIYDPANGGLYFDSDGTGSQAKTQLAQLSTGLSLTHENFAVI